MQVQLVTQSPGGKPEIQATRRRAVIASVITGSIVFHLILGLGAGIWIVAKIFTPPPATFEVRKDIRLPAQEREHRMNMAEFDALTPKPSFNEKLTSLRPTNFALPDLPKVPMDQMLPLDPSLIVSDQVSSLVGSAGAGAGGIGAGGLGGTGSGLSFFGIESKGKRILLLFDVSASVKNKAERNGVPLSKIKEETIQLLGGLPINSRFGMIQFVRNYKPFRTELLPATDANKKAAREWVEKEWSESGSMPKTGRGVVESAASGILGILEAALAMEPDVIFLISDGSFQRGTTGSSEDVTKQEIQSVLTAKEKTGLKFTLHFIGFEMKEEDQKAMTSIARKTGGTLKEVRKN